MTDHQSNLYQIDRYPFISSYSTNFILTYKSTIYLSLTALARVLLNKLLISSIERFSHIAEIIATHHENMDGSGFPNGLVGNDIPLEGRIIAVADRYDIINKIESKGHGFDESMSAMIGTESVKYDEYVLDALTEVLKKGDPFSQTAEIHLNEVKAGMTLAKPITNVDGVTLLSTGTRLRKDHIDIIMRYAGQGKLEEPISVYIKWSS